MVATERKNMVKTIKMMLSHKLCRLLERRRVLERGSLSPTLELLIFPSSNLQAATGQQGIETPRIILDDFQLEKVQITSQRSPRYFSSQALSIIYMQNVM